MFRKTLLITSCLLICILSGTAQVEFLHARVKNFRATGFGVFLNFSLHVSDANYATFEGGLQYFMNRYDEGLNMIPVVLGYRYTLNHSGSGIYIEPIAGYNFGSSTIGKYTENGAPVFNSSGTSSYEKVSGAVVGGGIGYLFRPIEKIQFNIGLSYAHTFGDATVDVIALRLTHAFNFGKKDALNSELR